MKKILVSILLLIVVLFCFGCSNGGKTEKDTIGYDSVYNAKADITISIGETKKSVNEKIKSLDYEIEPVGDGDDTYFYIFREDDDMIFSITFNHNGKVEGLGIFPIFFSETYDKEKVEIGAKADCDWCFKDGVTAQTTKEEMDTLFGSPSIEHSDEKGVF